MKLIFRKNNSSSPSHSPALPSHRAQVTWSLCVAIAVAIVAIQQAIGTHRGPERALATQSKAPAPLSQEELNASERDLRN